MGLSGGWLELFTFFLKFAKKSSKLFAQFKNNFIPLPPEIKI
jgi:hypothetical protein